MPEHEHVLLFNLVQNLRMVRKFNPPNQILFILLSVSFTVCGSMYCPIEPFLNLSRNLAENSDNGLNEESQKSNNDGFVGKTFDSYEQIQIIPSKFKKKSILLSYEISLLQFYNFKINCFNEISNVLLFPQ